jgi:hypothetical protein
MKIGNRYVQAPSHGRNFDGRKRLVVIHSLECDAREGLAYDLARGYIQNEGVSPHTLSDPGETVGVCDTDVVGYHIGGGNPYGTGAEVTGRAGWSPAQWNEPQAKKALERQAIALAAQCHANGFAPQDVRYLSLTEVADGHTFGCCTHNDVSTAPWGFAIGTNHWDPGPGYPYRAQMTRIRYYFGCLDYWGEDVPEHDTPSEYGAGGGGAQANWFAAAKSYELLALFG